MQKAIITMIKGQKLVMITKAKRCLENHTKNLPNMVINAISKGRRYVDREMFSPIKAPWRFYCCEDEINKKYVHDVSDFYKIFSRRH